MIVNSVDVNVNSVYTEDKVVNVNLTSMDLRILQEALSEIILDSYGKALLSKINMLYNITMINDIDEEGNSLFDPW